MRALLPVLVLLLASCGDPAPSSSAPTASPSTSSAPTPTPTRPPKPKAGTEITTYPSEFGPILFDASGQAIYLFDLESSPEPRCYDECAEAWPPVLTRGEPQASGKVRAGLLGTTPRSDGTTQVTYDGQPLYYYAHEGKRQVLCHNIEEYGGRWLVVQPDGNPAPG